MATVTAPRRHPLRLAGLVAVALLLVAALAALALFLWLRAYAPLDAGAGGFAPGPGLGADVEPVTGSGGKPVFIPAYRKGRPFDTAFTLHNTGRFAVTVTGLSPDRRSRSELDPAALLASDSSTASADPSNVHAFHRLRLDPGDSAIVVVRWRLDCGAGRAAEVYADSVPLRFRYLSTFTRTQSVRLPFAVTLRCQG